VLRKNTSSVSPDRLVFKQMNLISRLLTKLTLHNFKQIWQQYSGRKTAVCPCSLTYANICWFASLQPLLDVLVCFVMKSASFDLFFRFVFSVTSQDLTCRSCSDQTNYCVLLICIFFVNPTLRLYLNWELLVCLHMWVFLQTMGAFDL